MTTDNTNDPANTSVDSETSHGGPLPHKAHRPGDHKRRRNFAVTAIAGLALLALGTAAGAGAMRLAGPTIEMAPTTPVAITAMRDDALVTIKGTVAEVFGNKFVLQDTTGRTLIDTGRAGDDGAIVAKDEVVGIQGRFDGGFVHASFLTRADGKTQALGPAGGPPHDREHGREQDREPGPGWLRHMMK